MTSLSLPLPLVRPAVRAGVLLAVALGVGVAWGASAQTCERSSCSFMACGTPAVPVPSTLWGELESAETASPLPILRDSTGFQEFGHGHVESAFPWYSSVDVEAGTLFTTTGYGVAAWRRLANGELERTATVPRSGFPLVPAGELSNPLQDIDAPTGNAGVAAVSGYGEFGAAIIDFRPSSPKTMYQFSGVDASEVYTARLAGRDYAFVAATTGVQVLDMTAALGLAQPCHDNTTSGIHCPGVHKGKLGGAAGRSNSQYIDGTGNYVAVSYGSGGGFEIWDVGNPLQPVKKLTSQIPGAAGKFLPVFGLALWADGGKHYVALVTSFFDGGNVYEGRTYDVSCITGTCGSAVGPLDTMRVAQPSGRSFVTFSRAGGGRPFVHFGNDNRCAGGTREYLVDVSNPASIFDISPPGYWAYTTKFNRLWPGRGKFDGGEYFYRAANSVFDVHRLAGGSPPTANFSNTSPVYAGIPATFTDTSTGLVESREWSFTGGSPSIAFTSPVPVTFATPGSKQVSLVVGNGAGSDSEVKAVQVLDPTPAVTSVTQSPDSPLVCQPVTLTAQATGPGLAYAWTIKNSGGGTETTGAGNPFVWATAPSPTYAGAPAGTYTAEVVASNGFGSAPGSRSVTLGALAPLPGPNFAGLVSNDPFSFGEVTFHANVPGATEWAWDFGDGQGFGAWSNDPVTGPNPPAHAYTTTGAKNVYVKVRNCQQAAVTSASHIVTITEVSPLEARFEAIGVHFGASVNQAITFDDHSTGNPDQWFYAWNNKSPTSCSGYDAGHPAPVTTHTYTAAGGYYPCLKITRGSEVDEYPHPPIDVSGIQVTPRITVSGPSSGQVGTAYSFTASASDCSPSSSGWIWSTSGGSITGSATGPGISVSWATTGSKGVTARNSGCGTALGSRSISISGGDGGTLAAVFDFNPAAPAAGQPVAFNGAASTGSPASFDWSFGDGTIGNGVQVSHTYANAGTYTATLTVGTAGCVSPGCLRSTTKSVIVSGDGGGELAADFTYSPAAPKAGEAVGFDASPSTGSPATYDWSFSDGGTASGKVVAHTFAGPGTYDVSLTIGTAGCISPGCLRSKTVQVTVGEGLGANGCAGDAADQPGKLCLGEGGRWVVEVDWRDHHAGDRTGVGIAQSFSDGPSTGFFWFFSPDLVELIVKVLDGSDFNEHVWVFYGALSDVYYKLRVTDSLTNETREYENQPGSICGRGDINAFPVITGGGAAAASLGVPAPSGLEPVTGTGSARVAGVQQQSAAATAGEPLYLLDGRFKVTVGWRNQHSVVEQTGTGHPVTGGNASGYFWFFAHDNLEVAVKMVDARSFDGHFWVFWGGLSDVVYTVNVEDLETGETWSHTNPAGSICGGADTSAFPPLGG